MKTLDLDYFIGDTKPLRFALRDPTTNLAVDLSELEDAWFTLKEAVSDADADAIISKRLDAGISVVDATGTTTSGVESLLDVFPAQAETALLVAGQTYVFDLRLKTSDGKIETDAWGYLTARPPITNAAS